MDHQFCSLIVDRVIVDVDLLKTAVLLALYGIRSGTKLTKDGLATIEVHLLVHGGIDKACFVLSISFLVRALEAVELWNDLMMSLFFKALSKGVFPYLDT